MNYYCRFAIYKDYEMYYTKQWQVAKTNKKIGNEKKKALGIYNIFVEIRGNTVVDRSCTSRSKSYFRVLCAVPHQVLSRQRSSTTSSIWCIICEYSYYCPVTNGLCGWWSQIWSLIPTVMAIHCKGVDIPSNLIGIPVLYI